MLLITLRRLAPASVLLVRFVFLAWAELRNVRSETLFAASTSGCSTKVCRGHFDLSVRGPVDVAEEPAWTGDIKVAVPQQFSVGQAADPFFQQCRIVVTAGSLPLFRLRTEAGTQRAKPLFEFFGFAPPSRSGKPAVLLQSLALSEHGQQFFEELPVPWSFRVGQLQLDHLTQQMRESIFVPLRTDCDTRRSRR